MNLPRLPHIPLHQLGFLLLLEVLLLLLLLHRPPPRPPIASSSSPPAVNISEWTPPGGTWPTIGPAAAGTPWPTIGPNSDHGSIHIVSTGEIYSQQEQQAMIGELEQALAYVADRFGSLPKGRIVTYIDPEPDCILNGLAETQWRSVHVYTCSDIPRHKAVTILAHEYVHQLAADYYGPPHLQADLILSEGVATWAAGDYWLGGHTDFASFVREHYMDDLLPLATHYQGRSIHDMNQLYYQWASFVEFLITIHGRDKFDMLYISGGKAPGAANYFGIYGKGLDVLEQEWLVWLEE